MIGICLTARVVEVDEEAQQLHCVSMDIYTSGANAFRLACKVEQICVKLHRAVKLIVSLYHVFFIFVIVSEYFILHNL